MNMAKEAAGSLLLDSAPETSGAICILCLSNQIRQEDANLSKEIFSNFRSMADGMKASSISLSKHQSGEECKYLLAKLDCKYTEKLSQTQGDYDTEQIQSEPLNICISCMRKAQEELKGHIQHFQDSKKRLRPHLLQKQNRLLQSKSANSKFIFQRNKQFLVHDDQSFTGSYNITGNSSYLSKIAYNNNYHQTNKNDQNQEQKQEQEQAKSGQSKAKKQVSSQKKQPFLAETLALESNQDLSKKQQINFKKLTQLERLIVQGFPTKKQPTLKNMHRSIETLVERVCIVIEIPNTEEVTCKYCEYELEKQCAIKARTGLNAWVCRTCFTLHEQQLKLLSFDQRNRNQERASNSRRKRAETLSRAPRADRQNIQFLPYSRNTGTVSQNPISSQGNGCAVCEKKGVTLIRQKGKYYCIYCYYQQRSN